MKVTSEDLEKLQKEIKYWHDRKEKCIYGKESSTLLDTIKRGKRPIIKTLIAQCDEHLDSLNHIYIIIYNLYLKCKI